MSATPSGLCAGSKYQPTWPLEWSGKHRWGLELDWKLWRREIVHVVCYLLVWKMRDFSFHADRWLHCINQACSWTALLVNVINGKEWWIVWLVTAGRIVGGALSVETEGFVGLFFRYM